MDKTAIQKEKQKGISLIEVVIGSSILLVAMMGIMAAYSLYVRTTLSNTERLQATLLLEEGVEMVRILRDADWDAHIDPLSTGADYFVQQSGSSLSFVSGSEYIDGKFERSFEVFDVYRDGNDDIAISGTLDGSIKKVVVSVSWSTRTGTTTKEVTNYFADIF